MGGAGTEKPAADEGAASLGKLKDLLQGPLGEKSPRLAALEGDCYVCSRIEFSLSRMAETVVLLYEEDGSFREKFRSQPHFCLPHYRRLLAVARDRLGQKARAEFNREIGEVEERWFASLAGDVSAFCRSFDYRAEEPLTEEQKTSVERAVKGLSGLEGREVKPC